MSFSWSTTFSIGLRRVLPLLRERLQTNHICHTCVKRELRLDTRHAPLVQVFLTYPLFGVVQREVPNKHCEASFCCDVCAKSFSTVSRFDSDGHAKLRFTHAVPFSKGPLVLDLSARKLPPANFSHWKDPGRILRSVLRDFRISRPR